MVGTAAQALPGVNSNGADDMFIMKISSTGEVIRTVQYGSTFDEDCSFGADYFYGVAYSAADDSFLAVGDTNSALPGNTKTGDDVNTYNASTVSQGRLGGL